MIYVLTKLEREPAGISMDDAKGSAPHGPQTGFPSENVALSGEDVKTSLDQKLQNAWMEAAKMTAKIINCSSVSDSLSRPRVFGSSGRATVLTALWMMAVGLTVSIHGGQLPEQSDVPPVSPRPSIENGSNTVEQPSPFGEIIDHYKAELQKTNLAPQLRSAYLVLLQQYSQMNTRFRSTPNVKGLIVVPKPALAAAPVPLSLPNPSALAGGPLYQQMTAEHATNAQLWANLFDAQVEARKSNDKESVTRAEKQLADFLAVQLGKANRKISSGMSLAEIMKANGAQPGQKKFDRRELVWGILAGMMFASVLFFGFYKLGRRKA